MPSDAPFFELLLRHGRRLSLYGFAGVLGVAPVGHAGSAAAASRRVAVMGTWALVETSGAHRTVATAAAEAAVRALEAAEERLSTWRDDTPLAGLNRAPVGRRVKIGGLLAGELTR